MKICFTASSGGHLEEIACLKSLEQEHEIFLLTENSGVEEPRFKKIYYMPQTNRKEIMFIVKFIYIFVRSIMVLSQEKPDCIISTGALTTFPIALLGKIAGKKIIYIESFARVDTPSLTGKLIYKIADLFIVQWEELKEIYPKATYIGGIF